LTGEKVSSNWLAVVGGVSRFA